MPVKGIEFGHAFSYDGIPLLAQHFLERQAKRYRKPKAGFSDDASQALLDHPWPGNIRELKNLVQRLMILGNSEGIGVDEVKQALGAAPQVANAGAAVSFDQPLRDAREEFEKAYLAYQLDKHGGNVSEMAQEAGMERTHLYRKLKSHGIATKESRKA